MDKDHPSKVSLGDRQMQLSCRSRPATLDFLRKSEKDEDDEDDEDLTEARTITYLDDDILILRDDGDPLIFLEGHGCDIK